MDNIITVLSMNVRGLFSNSKKRADVFDWAKNKNTSIVCFQETHSSCDIEKQWEDEWGNKCVFSHYNNKSAGVCIMFKRGLDFQIHDSKIHPDGRYIILDLTLLETRITLVCLYGYNTDQPLFFQEILNNIASFSNTSLLLCGDWNVVQDCHIDTYNIFHNRNPNSRKKIEDIMEVFQLLDPWRTCFPEDRKYTWRQSSPIKQSRLDYFLVTDDIYSLMKNVKIIPGYKTDHSAIVFSFSASLAKRGKGYWKFNSQLLRDSDYVTKVKDCIADTISEYYVSGDINDFLNVKLSCNDQLFLEVLKMKIRTMSITHSIKKSKEEKQMTADLEYEIERLENIMNSTPSDIIQNELNDKKLELEEKRAKKIEGLLIRSRANWHENGEKCTEYFCKLEKKNFIQKTITELIKDDGIHISDQSKILDEQKHFYQTLYSKSIFDCNDVSFFNHDIKLTQEQRDLCEGNITYKECGEALKLMKNGKSPGSDGYTVDFYKFFWKNIGPFVFRSLYFGYDTGKFSDFQYQSIISCIPKESKDRRYISNWRPISLLNTDIKIASSIIATRVKSVLDFIISDTQKGFLKDRFMAENTRLLYDMMHYLEEHDKTGLLLLIDFEKAFDSVDWNFLKKALRSFNFGPSICKWFETFYLYAKSSVINNGHISDFFNLERGCRQGDPLSPYLFIIGVELLSIKLKSNPNIHGIVVDDSESLVSQYADDTFLVLDGTELSLKESLKCFESFYTVSGLKMNTSKTKALWIGNMKYSNFILCPEQNLNWSHSNFKLLGIDFSLDLHSITDINFAKKIKELSSILKSWQHRKLTLLGKITVIKSLLLPKLIHLFTALPNMSQSHLQRINTLFYNFIWNGRSDRIKRNTLIGDIWQGGLKMIHIESFNMYLKVSWVKRVIDNPTGDWQSLLFSHLKNYGKERAFKLQKEKLLELSTKMSNPFWRDVFLSLHFARPLSDQCNFEELSSLDVLNFVPLEDFKYYMNWKNYNIQFLLDLFDKETKDFLCFEQIKQKVNTNNFLRYYSLLSKIPKVFKDCIKENCTNTNFESINIEDVFYRKIVTNRKIKFIYKGLLENLVILPDEKFKKWEEILETGIDDWSNYFMLSKKACKDTYLANFQYKLLHRIIPTNSFLFKIKIKDTNLCTFCKIQEETIEHLFYECPLVHIFWVAFTQHINRFYVNFVLNKKCIFLGCQDESLFLNFLLVVTKSYIYKSKFKSQVPNIIGIKNVLKKYHSADLYTAAKNSKIYECERFWAPLQQIFENIF